MSSSNKTKGWIKNNVTGEKKSFLYNPTELNYSRGSTFADISSPGQAYPDTQFVKGEARVFPITLFFHDKPHSGKIKEYMNFIGRFLPPEVNKKNYTKPPDMTFCMGFFVRKCVLNDLNISITELDKDMNPVQAEFTLTLRQVGV